MTHKKSPEIIKSLKANPSANANQIMRMHPTVSRKVVLRIMEQTGIGDMPTPPMPIPEGGSTVRLGAQTNNTGGRKYHAADDNKRVCSPRSAGYRRPLNEFRARSSAEGIGARPCTYCFQPQDVQVTVKN